MKELNDWYRVSLSQVSKVVPVSVFSKFPLEKMLQVVYPQHPWDQEKLAVRNGKKTSQRKLAVMVKS